MHKEIVVVEGEKVEVETFDTKVSLVWPRTKVLKALARLLAEAKAEAKP